MLGSFFLIWTYAINGGLLMMIDYIVDEMIKMALVQYTIDYSILILSVV